MVRLILAGAALMSALVMAQAQPAATKGDKLGQVQVLEARKCKAGFKLNARKTRCVAIPTPGDSSSGGSFF